MQMIGSVIREQNVTFAVVLVREHVVHSRVESERMIDELRPLFGGLPVVLAAKNPSGRFLYYGRPDVSRFLGSIDPKRIPWNEYTVSV